MLTYVYYAQVNNVIVSKFIYEIILTNELTKNFRKRHLKKIQVKATLNRNAPLRKNIEVNPLHCRRPTVSNENIYDDRLHLLLRVQGISVDRNRCLEFTSEMNDST